MSNLRQFKNHLWLVLVLAASPHCSLSARQVEWQRFQASQVHMGVRATITVYCQDLKTAEAAITSAFQRIAELDQILSDYKNDSEINQWHRLADDKQFHAVSDDLWNVIRQSQSIHRQSNGAFDVTLGQLTQLWRTTRRTRQLPMNPVLLRARLQSGFEKIELRDNDQSVRMKTRGLRFDFGGIGKGYAADAALSRLHQSGISMAMVDLGGDLALGDPPPDKEHWHIALSTLSAEDPPKHFLKLRNGGVATSGDLNQFVEIDGQRYSHIIDPETGLGIGHQFRVTVVAESAAQADAWASAFSVLAPADAIGLAESKEGVQVTVVRKIAESIESYNTPEFPELHEMDFTDR